MYLSREMEGDLFVNISYKDRSDQQGFDIEISASGSPEQLYVMTLYVSFKD